jgi:proline racemase
MRFEKMITAVDAHAAGEPGRVITGGIVDVPGETMLEKSLYLQNNRDDIRKLMLQEPRGYPAMCCNIILPPTNPTADAGYVIMEHTEYPGMSGTNTICVVTVLLETGILPMSEPLTILTLEAPAGLIEVQAKCKDGKVESVTFLNVPAFAVYLDTSIKVPGIGPVRVDVAYGGMFYVIADAADFGLHLTPEEGKDIVRTCEMIRLAANEQLIVSHPDVPEFTGITISQLSAPPTQPQAHRKNAVTVATGEPDWSIPASFSGAIDRSPCGTGTCAKMAVMFSKGQLELGDEFVHESILGTMFTGRLIEETNVGDYPAVVPTISGQAWITGFANYVVDPADPFKEGFTVGDIW